MAKVQIWADLSDESFCAYLCEAQRLGVGVESLVEQTVNTLLREMEREMEAGADHPIIPR